MRIKLLLNPAAEAKECTHPDLGIKFMIRPISPAKYDEIWKASTGKDGRQDRVKWCESFAVAAIADWDNQVGDATGPLPCDEKNLRDFGRNHAINLMPWVVDQATSLEQYRLDEETAAKNA